MSKSNVLRVLAESGHTTSSVTPRRIRCPSQWPPSMMASPRLARPSSKFVSIPSPCATGSQRFR